MSERIRLFANGFEFDCWEEKNCDRCVKANWADGPITCELWIAINDAMFGDGTFVPEIVARFGWQEEYRAVLGWPCAELRTEAMTEADLAVHEMTASGAEPLPGFAQPAPAGGDR